MPLFYASEVAALLGLNRFKTKDEAMFRVLSNMPKYKPMIQRIKESSGKKTEREHVAEAPEEVKADLTKAVETALTMKSTAEIETKIEEFKKDATVKLIETAMAGKAAPPEFKAAAQKIARKETTVEAEVAKLEKSAVVESIGREIQKQRGTKLEAVAEDKHAVDTGKAVTDRGASARFECDDYILIGFIDGMQDGCVVETKNRKRVWKEPPNYDIVQLRCYMKMRGCVGGLLLESFPDGTTRKTVVPWDEDEWNVIHSGLVAVAHEVVTLTPERAEAIVRKCLI